MMVCKENFSYFAKKKKKQKTFSYKAYLRDPCSLNMMNYYFFLTELKDFFCINLIYKFVTGKHT